MNFMKVLYRNAHVFHASFSEGINLIQITLYTYYAYACYISYHRHGVPVSVDMVMRSHTTGTTDHNNSKIKLNFATNVKASTYLHFHTIINLWIQKSKKPNGQ